MPELGDFDRRHHLKELLDGLGLDSSEPIRERLKIFVQLLTRWNRIYNLTGTRDEAGIIREHLLDSLAVIPVLERLVGSDLARGDLLIDIGSGAGFPGLIVAALHPEWTIALVEPNGKKNAFLRQASAALLLQRSIPVQARLEDADSALRAIARMSAPGATEPAKGTRHFICRAVASLASLQAITAPVADEGSRLFAMKSRHLERELELAPQAITHSLHVPGLNQERTLVELAVSPHSSPAQ